MHDAGSEDGKYFFSNKVISHFVNRVGKLSESARRFVDNFLIGVAQLGSYIRTKLTRVRPVASWNNTLGDSMNQYQERLTWRDCYLETLKIVCQYLYAIR